MKVGKGHPHLDPYLDKDLVDGNYDKVKAHVESCLDCEEEVRVWQTVEATFRSPEVQIEVPPFQWRRIVARLEARQVTTSRTKRFLNFFTPHAFSILAPIRNVALAAALTAAIVIFGFQYFWWAENQRILSVIAEADSEWRQGMDENPFLAYLKPLTEVNPFELHHPGNENPFAVRQ